MHNFASNIIDALNPPPGHLKIYHPVFNPECDQPTNVEVAVGSSSATVCWVPDPDANATQIQYRPLPVGSGGMNTVVAGGGVSCKNLNGLSASTTYQMRMRNSCGFDISPFKFKPFATLGVREKETLETVSVLPNPASEFITVSINGLSERSATVSLLDISGKVINQQITSGNQSVDFHINNLSAGLYLVNVKSKDTNFSELVMVAK